MVLAETNAERRSHIGVARIGAGELLGQDSVDVAHGREHTLAVEPLAVAGASEPLLALVALTNSLLGLFQHGNVDFRLGALSWIFSVGEMHRWHHSVKLSEANHNYGSNFLFWDVVFGTRYLPVDRMPPREIGIEALPDFPPGYWAHLTAPIRWKEIEQSSAACYGSRDDALRPSRD